MKSICWMSFFLMVSLGQVPAAILSENGAARTVIVVDPAATAAESYAALELASTLHQITGAYFEVWTNADSPARSILVGPGAAASAAFGEAACAGLGDEELVIRTQGDRILLAGGRPRGTLYAVSRFLQDACGVRWWTAWASRVPQRSSLQTAAMNVREKPAFEYRDPFWYCGFDPDWSWHNFCNGQTSRLTPEKGGCVMYVSNYFVHTFYRLVPPEKYFAAHPEWFSLVDGKRTTNEAQLCLSNPDLRDFVVQRVKEVLRQSPEASIISVAQNDWFKPCECANCKAQDDAEGTHAGSLLSFVNYIAEKIQPEFPNVAVDTLAYQYTRKPTRELRPRPNVIVRLSSIECNFRQPLDSRSNASFAADIHGWEQRTDRLYVWDYVTGFQHYLEPFPDWFELGSNLRFFQAHHVRGVFEEGAYESYGAEMAEMRAWVLARLMWNPRQELMQKESRGYNLTCLDAPTNAPFLRFKPLARAEALWRQAELAVADDDALLPRVRLGHLGVQCVWLERWDALREECSRAGAKWPFAESRGECARRWLEIAEGIPGKPWTRVGTVREGELTPRQFVSQMGIQ